MYPSAKARRTRGARDRSGTRTPASAKGTPKALEDADALLHLRALRVPVARDEGLGDNVLLQHVFEVPGMHEQALAGQAIRGWPRSEPEVADDAVW